MRFAVLGLSHEANTFSPYMVTAGDFAAAGVLRGERIVARHAGGTSTVSGFLSAGERHGVEMVPLVMTTLTPSGPIAAGVLGPYADELAESLRAHGPFDGVLAALHGAAVAEDELDVDGHLLERFRDVVGPDVPIGVSLDLHANISPAMCAHSDVLNTYRTNPHVDAREVAEEVAGLIVRTARGEIRPTQALMQVPAAINILRQHTGEPPMRDIVDEVRLVEDRPDVLSASVAEGYPYADVPEMGMAAVVVTDDNEIEAATHAVVLAERVWRRREEFEATAPSPAQAIDMVKWSSHRPILLLDVGDNIGGGSPGDSVVLLHAARQAGLADLLIIVADAAAAAACTEAGVGAEIDLSIGGTSGFHTGPPVRSAAAVLALHHGTYQATEPVHAGYRHFEAGPSAAVRLDTGQTVIVTTRVVMPLSTAQLTTLGLSVKQFQAVVAKGVHSPLASYGPQVATTIHVDTPGVTSADLQRFDYRRRRRPLYPLDRDASYPPEEKGSSHT